MKRDRMYWRSFADLERTPEFAEAISREFPNVPWESLPSPTRRQFLKVMGASMAMGGLAACRWPREHIVPFDRRPHDRVPGVPQRFATAAEIAGVGVGLLVTSHDGRPIKVEGNPSHPTGRGAASAHHQALVLEMYDLDRSRFARRRDGDELFHVSMADAASELEPALQAARGNGGRGLAVLSAQTSSPSVSRLRRKLSAELPDAQWVTYEPLSRDGELEGTRLAFAQRLRPYWRLDQARVVACFDADPLGSHPDCLRLAREWADVRRDIDNGMSRWLVVEPDYSLTGAAADHRVPATCGAVPTALQRLARELAERGLELPAELATVVARAPEPASGGGELAAFADELMAHRGAGLVAVGSRQPAAVHALAHVLNRALGNEGETVVYLPVDNPERRLHLEALTELGQQIEAGEVTTLVILGGNPVYDAPADLDVASWLEKVPTSVHLGLYVDETSERCSWHLPSAHLLESWGDVRASDGTVSVIQPLIEPLFGGWTPVELLSRLLGEPQRAYEIVRATVAGLAGGLSAERAWQEALASGVVAGTQWTPVTPSTSAEGLAMTAADLPEHPPACGADSLEVVLRGDASVLDGRFANNPWLQEMPDPLTCVTWDNAALMAPSTAKELGLTTNDVVKLTVDGRELELPVYVLPGHAPYSVTVPLGYGRTAAGEVGNGVGVNASTLRTSSRFWSSTGATVEVTGRARELASTQDHHIIDAAGFKARQERLGKLVREGTLTEYREHPDFVDHRAHMIDLFNLWEPYRYEGMQWGMAIDLNACIGCGACVVACQAENNVPVVGREQVIEHREMHWLRLDRYFTGTMEDIDNPQVAFLPLACVHCENAPCEQVCPVAATVHNDEGLNQMVYNRCIGTRYCSNNCPYKVRRFNFFQYHPKPKPLEKMQFNPEVTVRARGVMEKCTYCTQRIEAVKIEARNNGRAITDGEIVPACAQTCPTGAIVFGDLSDPDSKVSQLLADQRSYAMLGVLNVRPRTRYLARLRNPVDGGSDHGAHGSEGPDKESHHS
jgi:molybdopterin-containing oxidoreductase family iron-sulfur binding subunit